MRDYIKSANAHIEARKNNNFTDTAVHSKRELKDALLKGDTFGWLLNEIAMKYVSITSLIMSSTFDYETEAYKRAVRKGFKILFKQMEQW